jgi:hypothetical protein
MDDEWDCDRVGLFRYKLAKTWSFDKFGDENNAIDAGGLIPPFLYVLEFDYGWAPERIGFVNLCPPKLGAIRIVQQVGSRNDFARQVTF